MIQEEYIEESKRIMAEAWVTQVTDEVEATQALILSQSLRKCETTKKLIVLLTENISDLMRTCLLNGFDHALIISETKPKNGFGIFKILYRSLKEYRKCVYVNSGIQVEKNCDWIFENQGFHRILIGEQDSLKPSMIILSPSETSLELLVESANISVSEDEILTNYFGKGEAFHFPDLEGSINFITTVKSVGLTNIGKPLLQLQHFAQDVSQHPKVFIQSSIKNSNINLSFFNYNKDLGYAINPPMAKNDVIAVIGMSCRFPGSNSVEEFWEFLCSGQDGITELPPDRPIPKGDKFAKKYREHKAGYLKCPVDEFDANFFGISPREAEEMSPQQRLLLEITWESLEDAGINPQDIRGSKTGVYIASWQQEYGRIFMRNQDFLKLYQGNSFNTTAAKISFHFGLNGPNLGIESGCSSSLNALHLASESLRKGECNMAIVGGINLLHDIVDPTVSPVLSNSGKCHSFDKSADGFVRSEGCGVVILKRLSDAYVNKDNVICLIRGSAMNQDGSGGGSFGTPSAAGQEMVIKDALRNSKVVPSDITYIEAHGTGTPVGDPIEISALTTTYACPRKSPIILGACKSNIGHSECTAGMAGLIKVILSMRNKKVPPNINFNELNPNIDLDLLNCVIPTEVTEWNSGNRIAGLSAFAFGGNNVHVILQKPTGFGNDIIPIDYSGLKIITLSAKSPEALNAIQDKYKAFIKEQGNSINLGDIAYTSAICRAHFKYRSTFIASTLAEFNTKLQNQHCEVGNSELKGSKIGFLFPGEGTQYIKMAQGICNEIPHFKANFIKCSDLANEKLGVSLFDICNDETLFSVGKYYQPALFSVQYCIFKLWEAFGVRPDYVLGHSVGEFAAAVCAGIISLEDGMHLIIERCLLVDSVRAGAMLAVKSNLDRVNSLIEKFLENNSDSWLDIAAINAEDQVVVSGRVETISQFELFCKEDSIKTKMLSATRAYHSRDFDSFVDEYQERAEIVKYNKPSCTYISGCFAKEMDDADFNSRYWPTQTRNRVNFAEAVGLLTSQCKIVIEIGSHPILTPLAMSCSANLPDILFCPSLRRNAEDMETWFSALSKLYTSGVDLNWRPLYERKQVKKISLPFYQFQRKKFWFYEEENNINFSDSEVLHPLLGFTFPSPNTTFQNYLNLDKNEKLSYLNGHNIADRVIMPGASYLEMTLAAGNYKINGNVLPSNTPLLVKSIDFQSALHLNQVSLVHTIIAASSSKSNLAEGFDVKIFSSDPIDGSKDWTENASGIVGVCSQGLLETIPRLEIGSTIASMELKDIDSMYSQLKASGYNFNNEFLSLKALWENEYGVLSQIETDILNDLNSYICHPVVLDAMFQTATMLEFIESGLNYILLPITMNKFVWFGRNISPTVFCHFRKTDSSLTLYSETGEPLAYFKNLECIKTTAQTLAESLSTGSEKSIPFYTEEWLPFKEAPRIDSQFLPAVDSNILSDTVRFLNSMKSCEIPVKIQNDICTQYIIKGIQECGWSWVVGEQVEEIASNWNSRLPLALKDFKLVHAYLDILLKAGYINSDGIVVKSLLSAESCEELINKMIAEYRETDGSDEIFLQMGIKCGSQLPAFLRGEVDGLTILFSKTDEFPCTLPHLYSESTSYLLQIELLASIFQDITNSFGGGKIGCLRILEIGAGIGSASAQIQRKLVEIGIQHEYTYTDISQHVLNDAENKFGSIFEYKVLNIEMDPLSQGFCPAYYDVLIGFQVLHATKNVEQSLRQIHKVIKPGGVLVLGEFFTPASSNTLIFGLLEGWWRFNDFRTISAMVGVDDWKALFVKSGFSNFNSVQIPGMGAGCIIGNSNLVRSDLQSIKRSIDSSQKVWICITHHDLEYQSNLSDKLDALERNIVSVRICSNVSKLVQVGERAYELNGDTMSDFISLLDIFKNIEIEGIVYSCTTIMDGIPIYEYQKMICGTLLHLTQALTTHFEMKSTMPRFILLTRGVHYIGDGSRGNPNSATLWGLTKTFGVENPSMEIRLIDLDPNLNSNQNDIPLILEQFWDTTHEQHLAIRDGKSYVHRYLAMPEGPRPMKLPTTDTNYEIQFNGNSIEDGSVKPTKRFELEAFDVEVEVRATGINFRDLFQIFQPDGYSAGSDPGYGFEVSGIVSKIGNGVSKFEIGDQILGFIEDSVNGFASHNVIKEERLMSKPESISFVQAASFPCVFATAYASLVNIAKISNTDNVLIHAGSGGVGLAAIQIAKYFGATIFATAGSNRKREYLRSIGVQHVYRSRDHADFKNGIIRDSNGKLITVVLNSLTSKGFKEASLEVCARNARFVEIAKTNIWSNQEIKILRPDVDYTIYDLFHCLRQDAKSLLDVCISVYEQFLTDWQKISFPIAVFPLDRVKDALLLLKGTKHIGKIVIQHPSLSTSIGIGRSLKYNYFDSNSTHLITGGLGGIGLELLQWMTSVGARHIVLVGRSQPSKKAQDIIAKSNANILVLQADVGIYSECESLLNKIPENNFPPLRGIMHAAGTLSDGVISNQSWEKFEHVFNAKVYGGWNLHSLTLTNGLDYFLMFSSISALVGMFGLSNYCAANFYLNSLAHYRHSLGLSASTINWGSWKNIGLGVNFGYVELSEFFTAEQGIRALEKFIRTNEKAAVIGKFNWRLIKEKLQMGRLLDDMKLEKLTGHVASSSGLLSQLENKVRETRGEDRVLAIQNYLEYCLRSVLKIPPNDNIPLDQNLTDLGMDSLITMEFRNMLKPVLEGRVLPMVEFGLNPTLETLSLHLNNLLEE